MSAQVAPSVQASTTPATGQMPPLAVCERARLSRDARFDGLFFVAVTSTGIYCRPLCPARTALRRNVRYYPSAAAASVAGFRPCRRCRPELSPSAWHGLRNGVLQRALAMIDEGYLQDHSAAQMAERLGVTARHMQRLFVAGVGASPHAVHATRRLLLAQQLLHETPLPITQVAQASGYASLRRFNAEFLQACGQPPTAVRRAAMETDRREPQADALTLRLAFRPPMDSVWLLRFLAARALPGIEQVDAKRYCRWLAPSSMGAATTRAACLRVTPDPAQALVRVSIDGAEPTQLADLPALLARVRRVFDLHADEQAIGDVLGGDPLLAPLVHDCSGGLRIPGAWDGFELALRSIVGRQISVAATRTLLIRLHTQFGVPAATDDPSEPARLVQPQRLADAPLERIGLPRSRAAALRALARAVADGALSFDAGQSLQPFIAAATELPGIGDWTAHYIALRGLGLPDAFPAGDLVLRQQLARLLGLGALPSVRQVQAMAERWRPWRGYALMLLWRASATAKPPRPPAPRVKQMETVHSC